ncbi:uncharacterized protein LOC120421792 [Culex pipiens pallens]|uniref:uncharacterized protein LOC120421792 n=1 Tax=Culex pipiens pallens TaxID=42434 RepID=UPI00195347CF|nr:uncharacterized protein LOC120421792 [Culex pipiens pallens]
MTAANVAKASTGELQEKLTNEGPRNRREGSKSALPGEKKRNLEIVSKVLKKKPPVTLELLSTRRRELPEQHRRPQRSSPKRRSPPPWVRRRPSRPRCRRVPLRFMSSLCQGSRYDFGAK